MVKIMSKKNQWVSPAGGKWKHQGEGNTRATGVYDTQKEARTAAREAAIKNESELIVQNKHGQIREKNSYGNDPKNIKG